MEDFEYINEWWVISREINEESKKAAVQTDWLISQQPANQKIWMRACPGGVDEGYPMKVGWRYMSEN